jgi:nucleoside-diphosphate-sugar epimerase
VPEQQKPLQKHLFCYGAGYSAQSLAKTLLEDGWDVSGTSRSKDGLGDLSALGICAHVFSREETLAPEALDTVTHVLSSVPPDALGDPVLDQHATTLARLPHLQWVGYLSTTGVYGNTDGQPVDETSPLNPSADRSRRRVSAEAQWLRLHQDHALPVHIFRLAGIYGPGRSALEQARRAPARRIKKPGHLFSRIHVEDIAECLFRSIAQPSPGSIYNVCDDEPAEPADVLAYACELLGELPPPLVPFEDAEAAMSPMGRSFWQDNRRVLNTKIKTELGLRLRYPTYREGLKAIADGLDIKKHP